MGSKETRKRSQHLRVPVLPEEKDAIETLARMTGRSVASYLREVGMGYRIEGIVDAEKVEEMARINGDLGRLGGLLKLWLTNDERTFAFGADTIRAVLSKIETTQDELGKVMLSVVQPRSGR